MRIGKTSRNISWIAAALSLTFSGCGGSDAKKPAAGTATVPKAIAVYTVNMTMEGLVALVPKNEGGDPVVWALLPRLDDQKKPVESRRRVRGTTRLLPAHHTFLKVQSKNLVKGETCWADAERGAGNAPVLLALGAEKVTAPNALNPGGHEVILTPGVGNFIEGPVTIRDPDLIPLLKAAPFQSEDDARVKAVYHGADRSRIKVKELAARIKFSKGVLIPKKGNESGPYVYGFYQGDLEVAGGKIDDLAEKVMITLTYAPGPLVLTLEPFEGIGSQERFVLCPSPTESTIDLELLNLPISDAVGIPGEPRNTSANRDEHFIAYYNLSATLADMDNHAFVFPLRISKGPGGGGDPYCSHVRMEP